MRKVLFISSTIVGSILSLLVQAKAQQVGQVQVNFEGFAGKVVESRASLLSISKVGDGHLLFVQGGPGAANNPQ